MNILEIVSGRRVNGATMHAVLLSRELAVRGHSVTVVCRPGVWIEQERRGSAVDVFPSDLHRWPADELRRIAALVDARAIDVVHTHMRRAHFFGALLRSALARSIRYFVQSASRVIFPRDSSYESR